MAIDNSGQLDTLAGEIVDAVEAISDPTSESTPAQARQFAIDSTKIICQKIMAYLITYMEIKGISTTVASGIVCAVDPGTHIGATTGTGAGEQNDAGTGHVE